MNSQISHICLEIVDRTANLNVAFSYYSSSPVVIRVKNDEIRVGGRIRKTILKQFFLEKFRVVNTRET
jgi:hypothetical protein